VQIITCALVVSTYLHFKTDVQKCFVCVWDCLTAITHHCMFHTHTHIHNICDIPHAEWLRWIFSSTKTMTMAKRKATKYFWPICNQVFDLQLSHNQSHPLYYYHQHFRICANWHPFSYFWWTNQRTAERERETERERKV